MYGTWTVVVLLYFSEVYFSPGNALMSAGLWISHAGMALEGFLLLPYLAGVRPFAWGFTAAWFLALDAVDYFYSFTVDGLPMSTHPLAILEYVRNGTDTALQAKIDSLIYVTFGLSAIFFVTMIACSRSYGRISHEKNAIKKEIRT
ncbi:MAG: hypothetical protein A4E28_01362 [Methanocella sp. PtaU1.Bin125]|nr:MAG: hypothetical protein A4E28_01362 [Methanocella sp. PtaU1.Bin125]